jgi:hypothetical protein
MSTGNITLIVGIGTIISMVWAIRKAESCAGVVINATLVIIAGIAVLFLISAAGKSLGLF